MTIPLFYDYYNYNNNKKFNGFQYEINEKIILDEETPTSSLPSFLESTFINVTEEYSQNYYYPIYLSYTIMNEIVFDRHSWLKVVLPKKIIEDIKIKKCKILLHNIYEGYSLSLLDKFIKSKILVSYNFGVDDIILCTANVMSKSELGIKNICYNFFEESLQSHYSNVIETNPLPYSLKKIYESKQRDYKFISLQRRPKAQRLALFTELYEYRQYGILTQGIGDDNNINTVIETEEHFKKYYPTSYTKYKKNNYREILPLTYDVNLSVENPAFDRNIDINYLAYLNIVSETYFENQKDRMFFSEKIFKPIIFLQPFVLFGQSHSLENLKKQGYQTFENFIDEDYDKIDNNEERFNAATISVKKFINKSYTDLDLLHKEMMPILIHNYKNLKVRMQSNKYKMLDDLRNYLN